MTKAQVIHELGPPGVMQWEEWPVPDPAPGRGSTAAYGHRRELRRHLSPRRHLASLARAALPGRDRLRGRRRGRRRSAKGSPGFEPWATESLTASRRSAAMPSCAIIRPTSCCSCPTGSTIARSRLLLMKGMTAHYLLHRTYRVQPGDTILVHAAAGGMGLILCQWAKALGATIVGTVSTAEKRPRRRGLPAATHPVVRSQEDFVAKVARSHRRRRRCGRLRGDRQGHASGLTRQLCRPMGVCAAYGHVSGPPDPVDIIQDLGRRGSLFITRPGDHALRGQAGGSRMDGARSVSVPSATESSTPTSTTSTPCARPSRPTRPSRAVRRSVRPS